MRIFSYSTYGKEKWRRDRNDTEINWTTPFENQQCDINKDIEEILSNSILRNNE